jgi:uncharacterized protein
MPQRRLITLTSCLLAVAAQSALHGQESKPVAKLPIAQLQNLADSGDPAAQNELGIRYRLGNDVEKDPAKAVPWFLKAAKQGYAKAYFNLGAAYYNGDGVPENTQNSCAYFIFSADAGDERGQQALARTRSEMPSTEMNRCEVMAATAYLTGDLIKSDNGLAVKWYTSAANAGDGFAAEKVAYLYDRGIGVASDKAASLKWLQRSADLNFAPAIYELGLAYEAGNVVPTDLSRARKLYEQAALLGLPQAFASVGAMYSQGRGVKQDREKALAYYIVALNNGVKDAKPKVDELSSQLSQKQVKAAQQDAVKLVSSTRSPVLLLRR